MYIIEITVRGPIQELRHCLGRGLPIPVLHLVEYLSTDAGGMRWGRGYTGAGNLSFILLWYYIAQYLHFFCYYNLIN